MREVKIVKIGEDEIKIEKWGDELDREIFINLRRKGEKYFKLIKIIEEKE